MNGKAEQDLFLNVIAPGAIECGIRQQEARPPDFVARGQAQNSGRIRDMLTPCGTMIYDLYYGHNRRSPCKLPSQKPRLNLPS